MKTIRVLMMMMAAVAVIGFQSCKDDVNDIIDDGNGNLDTYLTVNIDIPNGSSSLRSAEYSGTEEAGQPDEYKVTSTYLYFFDSTNKYVTTVSFTGPEIILPTTASGENRVLVTAKKNVALTRGATYNAYAIVNGQSNNVTLSSSTTEDDFLKGNKLADVATSVSPTIPSNGFVMASRTPDGASSSSPFVSLTISTLNNVDNPANLKMSVERTVGKLMLSANTSDNKYQILDGSSNLVADVELSQYAVVNAMKNSFTFRHTAAVGQVNQAAPLYQYGHIITGTSDYLMDPLTHEKTITDITNYSKWTGEYINHASTITGAASVTTAMPTTANVVLGYCYENATEQTAQKNGYSTGIIFKATVVPAANQIWEKTGPTTLAPTSIAAGVSFYHCEGKLYKDVDAVMVDYPAIPAGTSNLNLKTVYDVDYLENGVCYYKYWIKHEDNLNPAGDPVMGIMEYSIVRNNVYKMKVTGINSIGSGVPPIDPEDDNETTNVYLKMEMTILPWIVRSQEDIKL